jgi:hypothetical protein
MGLGKLAALGLIGVLAYASRYRIGAFVSTMAPTGRAARRRNGTSGTGLRDDVRPVTRGRGRNTRVGTDSVVYERELSQRDPVLESIASREHDKGAEPGFIGSDDINKPVGAIPRSTITGRHDDGTDANETLDGLGETEELTRRLAEDTPTGSRDDEKEIPVFERGRTPTRI